MGQSSGDAHRLVVAAEPMLRQHFKINTKERKSVMAKRATLTRAIRSAFNASRRHGGAHVTTRDLLTVACTTAVMLASEEK